MYNHISNQHYLSHAGIRDDLIADLSIHHVYGVNTYVTVKLAGTLNNTTLSPPLLFSPMSRVMGWSGSSRQVPITLLQVPVNGLTFGTTVSFLPRLVQSQGFKCSDPPVDPF